MRIEKDIEVTEEQVGRMLELWLGQPVSCMEMRRLHGGALSTVLDLGFGVPPHKAVVKVSRDVMGKAFTDEFYRRNCRARLQPVLDTIRRIDSKDIHLEVTTLLIPGENDSYQEINAMAEYLSSINPLIPWHISRFFPRHKFMDRQPTPVQSVRDAVNTGHENGLRYVYAGNVADQAVTHCHSCGNVLIARTGFKVVKSFIDDGVCSVCGTALDGVWL